MKTKPHHKRRRQPNAAMRILDAVDRIIAAARDAEKAKRDLERIADNERQDHDESTQR